MMVSFICLNTDYGFEIPDLFVVGYALDYNEHFRDLNVSFFKKHFKNHCFTFLEYLKDPIICVLPGALVSWLGSFQWV